MSHFTCLVILPKGKAYTEQLLGEMMEKYSENIEVEPYLEACYCVGNEARRFAKEKAERETGKTFDDLRSEHRGMDESVQPEWSEFISDRLALEERCEKEHHLYQKPQADCEDCEGEGLRKTTYNPDSKWDWYQVGGRWGGLLQKKDGIRADVAKVKDIDFKEMESKARENAEKSWEESKDMDSTERYFRFGIEKNQTKEKYLADAITFTTYSVLTGDKQWHERGQMGWFAMVIDEKETEEEWVNNYFSRFIENLDPETTIVVVDCHI